MATKILTKDGLAKLWQLINDKLDNKLDKAKIVNDLTTGGIDKALSAEQGKVLFQNVDNGKQLLANAIIGKGQTGVSKDSTFAELADKITKIKTPTGDQFLKGAISTRITHRVDTATPTPQRMMIQIGFKNDRKISFAGNNSIKLLPGLYIVTLSTKTLQIQSGNFSDGGAVNILNDNTEKFRSFVTIHKEVNFVAPSSGFYFKV